jgi:hypothetical protein
MIRNLRGPTPETWHERFMRLGAAKDYAGCLAMLRSPAVADTSDRQDRARDEPPSSSQPPSDPVGGDPVEGCFNSEIREAAAFFIWERFAPSHEMEFAAASNRDEYLKAADAILNLCSLNPCSKAVRP